jgi:hypothetical protein
MGQHLKRKKMRKKTDKDKKYIERNQKSFDELVQFIEDNKDDVRLGLVSPEMGAYLILFDLYDEEEYTGNIDGVLICTINDKPFRFVIDPYLPASIVQFVMKGENTIKFDVPCVCGIYGDEKHP